MRVLEGFLGFWEGLGYRGIDMRACGMETSWYACKVFLGWRLFRGLGRWVVRLMTHTCLYTLCSTMGVSLRGCAAPLLGAAGGAGAGG